MTEHASGRLERDSRARRFFEHVKSTALDECPEGKQVALIERTARARCMAPLHTRDEDETYRVIEGELTFYIGEDRLSAHSGDVVVAPAGVARTFQVGSGGARWLVLTNVSSLPRFEEFGRAVCAAGAQARPAEWLASEDAAMIRAIGNPNGIELLGPPGMLPEDA